MKITSGSFTSERARVRRRFIPPESSWILAPARPACHCRHRQAAQLQLARVGFAVAKTQPQGGGFACAVGSEQPVAFSAFNGKAHPAQHLQRAVGFVQPFYGEDGHARLTMPRMICRRR